MKILCTKEWEKWQEDERVKIEKNVYQLEDEINERGFDEFIDIVIKNKNFKYNFFIKRFVSFKVQYRMLYRWNGNYLELHYVYCKNRAKGQCDNDFNGKYVDEFKDYIKSWERKNKELITDEFKRSI